MDCAIIFPLNKKIKNCATTFHNLCDNNLQSHFFR
ncbi:MAG: hypothetical protein Faunusvirus5_29 [Faunusvirus sp.]|uniref:Uncharacterized protein n=1 Tax=Faunusvirus sp. TaxID=2487766 RepID=A0A3G4ZWJ7_9VIRU|nr:MAG: hypothetical protein Faunusvirus5_29 [Faunusvirus sp.]